MSGAPRIIAPRPITRAAYAPYGDLLSADDPPSQGESANHGTATKFGFLADLENRRSAARPNVSVFRAKPIAHFPHSLLRLEKHPQSTQMFVPMNAARFLVVVALGGDAPDLGSLAAFVATGAVGITYRPGTWHHPLLALDHVTDFAGLVWEDGTGSDCVEITIADAIAMSAP